TVGKPGLGKPGTAQAAAVAQTAGETFRGGIVARPAQRRVEPEAMRLGGDARLAPVLQRRVDRERTAFDAVLGREARGLGEAGDELGAAVGITRVVERVH